MNVRLIYLHADAFDLIFPEQLRLERGFFIYIGFNYTAVGFTAQIHKHRFARFVVIEFIQPL